MTKANPSATDSYFGFSKCGWEAIQRYLHSICSLPDGFNIQENPSETLLEDISNSVPDNSSLSSAIKALLGETIVTNESSNNLNKLFLRVTHLDQENLNSQECLFKEITTQERRKIHIKIHIEIHALAKKTDQCKEEEWNIQQEIYALTLFGMKLMGEKGKENDGKQFIEIAKELRTAVHNYFAENNNKNRAEKKEKIREILEKKENLDLFKKYETSCQCVKRIANALLLMTVIFAFTKKAITGSYFFEIKKQSEKTKNNIESSLDMKK